MSASCPDGTYNLTLVGTRDDNLYASTRVKVRIQLDDPWTCEPVDGLAPLLSFTGPDGLPSTGEEMEEIENGLYEGSYVPDTDGEWQVHVEIGPPYETLWHKSIYVSPR